MAAVRIQATLGYCAAYLGAMLVGQLVVLESTALALYWPAAGIAALWLLHGSTRRQVALDGALLFAVTTGFFAISGVGPVAALLFGAASLAQGLAVRAVSAMLEKGRFVGRLTSGITTTSHLVVLIAASVLAPVVGATLGTAASWAATGSWSWLTPFGWVVRDACGILVVTAVARTSVAAHRSRLRDRGASVLTDEPRRTAAIELTTAVALSLAAAALVFTVPQGLPIGYVMIAASIWLGLRFTPVVAALHSLGFGSLVLGYTYYGWGAVGAVTDLAVRGIVVQLFVMVTAVVALTLSTTVTEKNQLNARLRRSESRARARAELLDAVTEAMADGLCVSDSWGEVVLANSAAAELGGGDADGNHVHTPDAAPFHWPDGTLVPFDELPHSRALRGERVPSADVVRVHAETGQETVLSVSAVPLHQEAPVGPLAVVLLHDVTRERAERRVLENFAGVAAHDLKGPLTAVLSWAELADDQLAEMGDDRAVASVRDSMTRIRESSLRMNQLITDLLNYTLADNAELRLEPLSLDDLVASVVRDLGLRGESPVVEFDSLGSVTADPLMARQLFTNLIANAVKFVAPGVVPHVQVQVAPRDGMCEIRITDNGVGIPRKDRGHVFDTFFRSSAASAFPGTGLGLAICRRATDRHGGRISATAGPGEVGTTMIFTLPIDDSRSEQDAPSHSLPSPEAVVG